MTEFEQVLQECLHDLEQGSSTVEECLIQHPGHAEQLEPILLASAYLARGREARLSDAFRARVRSRLIGQMNAHPRKPARDRFMFMRLATGLAVILLALLAAGTAYAQSALPGDSFYAWKLASESAWRTVSRDPVGTDLLIAQRRADELIAVRDDPALYSQALNTYLELAASLKSEIDAENEARILAVLDSQLEELSRSGILLEEPEPEQEIVPVTPPLAEPTQTSTPTEVPILETVEVPTIEPTNVPQIVPTRDEPSETLPTALPLPPLPKSVPTIEVPPPIR